MINTTDYHHVIAAALLDIAKSGRSERVKALQAEDLSELERILKQYDGRCFDPTLICTIASKKVCWIGGHHQKGGSGHPEPISAPV